MSQKRDCYVVSLYSESEQRQVVSISKLYGNLGGEVESFSGKLVDVEKRGAKTDPYFRISAVFQRRSQLAVTSS